MADFKKPVFSPDAAEEYFSMLLTSYRDTANDIFRRENEGRHASEQHYSAEYQKYVGMQIAMREVLEYFGKYDLGDWISVKERLPEEGDRYLCRLKSFAFPGSFYQSILRYDKYGFQDGGVYEEGVTHWMPLPEPPEEEANE